MANLKKTIIDDNGFLKLPVGTSAQRPGSPQTGMIRWNSDNTAIEIYDGSWGAISGEIGTSANPAPNALALLANGITADGVYYIKGSDNAPTQQVYCILDSNWDGGGWMIIANNSAQGNIYTSGHVPRPTAFASHVGSNGANSYSANNNFSIDMTDVAFTEMAHVAYNISTRSFKDYLAYYIGSWNSPQTIPDTDNWYLPVDSSGYVINGLNARRLRYTSAGQPEFEILGFALSYSNATGGSGTVFEDGATGIVQTNGTDGDTPYPVFISTRRILNRRLAATFSFGEYRGRSSDVGWDDFQDGSGMGDAWAVENVGNNAYRGYPSFIMVR